MNVYKMLLILLLNLYSGMSISSREYCDDLKRAEIFFTSLIKGDETSLIKYMGKSNVFLTSGKLNKDIFDFLYKSEANEDGWKSINEIASMDKIDIKIIYQKSGVVTVLYFPRMFKKQMEDIKFLEEKWMKKYFACEFEVIDGKWEFYQNVCFSETDGPFPSSY